MCEICHSGEAAHKVGVAVENMVLLPVLLILNVTCDLFDAAAVVDVVDVYCMLQILLQRTISEMLKCYYEKCVVDDATIGTMVI